MSAAVAVASAGKETMDKTTAAEGGSTEKKHPLEHSWTLWFDNPSGRQKQTTWGQTLRQVYTFGTVEDFWCLYNNVVPPSRLNAGVDFHLFKEGIEPKWEDPRCSQGGKWTVQVQKANKNQLDTMWLQCLLAMIGEQFEDGNEICGAVISVRQRHDRIAIWTRTATNEETQIHIGKKMKEYLDVGDSVKIGYLVHEDAKQMDKRAKDRYTV